MKRRSIIAVLAFVVAISFIAFPAFASSHGKGGKADHGKELDKMLLMKAHMALKNQEELALTDEQAGKIKALKTETKKALIKQDADIQVVKVDMKAALWEDAIDTEAVGKLIDKKYEMKKAKAKTIVGAMAEFKKILTEEQMDKLQEICEARKEEFKARKSGCKGCKKGKGDKTE